MGTTVAKAIPTLNAKMMSLMPGTLRSKTAGHKTPCSHASSPRRQHDEPPSGATLLSGNAKLEIRAAGDDFFEIRVT